MQVLASVGSSRVDIQWFFNDTTSQAILHITDTESFPPLSAISYLGNQTVIDDDMWTLSSRITFSSLTSPTHQGMYVCQVALDGNIALFSPSDSLLIESEEVGEYLNFHPCSRMLFKDTMKCAGNISSSSTSSSTTLSLTTPISTLTTSVSTAAIPIATTSSNISLTVYFPIAVAAMFGMIMVVLSIISVGLCLKKMITSKSEYILWLFVCLSRTCMYRKNFFLSYFSFLFIASICLLALPHGIISKMCESIYIQHMDLFHVNMENELAFVARESRLFFFIFT